MKETKTLNTVQTLAKVGRILSKIVYILSIVSGILCIVGIVGLALIPDGIKIGGVTIRGLIEKDAGISVGTCFAGASSGIVFCAGEAVLSRFAVKYFKNELAAGTPFTAAGAKELMRLGILAICIPVGTSVVAAIVYAIMKAAFENVADMPFRNTLSIGLGVMFIVTSLICRHGAEISEEE